MKHRNSISPGHLLRRAVLALALALLPLAALAAGHPAVAQTPSLPDLALAEFDLPGFTLLNERSSPPSQGIDALFTRTFAGPDQDQSVLIDVLAAPVASAPASLLSQVVSSGAPLETLRDSSGSAVANYQLNGPLGIGELDQSAAWDSYSSGAGQWYRFSADVFLRNGIVAVIAYAAPSGAGDPSLIATYAGLQDAKLAAVGQ